MHTYPHKIENGEGEVITFLGVVRDRDGDRMEVELLAPPNVGAPMHLHHLQEEAITVVAGKLGLQFAGEQPRYAEPGETIILKRAVGHRWWNAGTTELRCTWWATPPEQPRVLSHGSLRFDEAEWTKTPGLLRRSVLADALSVGNTHARHSSGRAKGGVSSSSGRWDTSREVRQIQRRTRTGPGNTSRSS